MKRCLEPGCRQLTDASRCPAHARARYNRKYGGRWDAYSRALRGAVGRCEECGSPDDLTTDHVIAGTLAGGVRVLCRPCNSRKGDAQKFGLVGR